MFNKLGKGFVDLCGELASANLGKIPFHGVGGNSLGIVANS